MARMTYTITCAIAGLLACVNAQCVNRVAQYQDANTRSSTGNNSMPRLCHILAIHVKLTFLLAWLVVPVPKNAVLQALKESFPLFYNSLKLLDPPAELKIPATMHPVLAINGYMADIRQSVLQLNSDLESSATQIPYVGINGSPTPFNAPLNSYIVGTGANADTVNKYLYSLVPAVVATLLGGLLTKLGDYIPNDAAYKYETTEADGRPVYASNSKWAQIPNFVSGPGVYVEAVDMRFSTEPAPKYTEKQMRHMINQPLFVNVPLSTPLALRCQRNTYFFNNDTAQVTFRSGNVTFGPAATPNTLAEIFVKAANDGAGGYNGVQGISGCAQVVGYNTLNGEDCEKAAMNVDKTAL
jgi:hypothetical protein